MRPLDAMKMTTRAATLALATTLAGCGLFRGDEAGPARDAEFAATRPVSEQTVQTSSGNVPGVLQPINRPILQGPLPLIYLTETAGTLRITSVATGEEIAIVEVKPMQILRVEPRGVVLAGEVAMGATLTPGLYAITPLADNAGVVRTEQIRVRPTVPTSQPAPAEPAVAAPPSPTADTPPPQ